MTGPQPDPAPVTKPAKRKRTFGIGQIVGIVLLVLVAVFVIENTNSVQVRLIIPSVHAPLAVALLIAAVLGALAVLLIQFQRRRK